MWYGDASFRPPPTMFICCRGAPAHLKGERHQAGCRVPHPLVSERGARRRSSRSRQFVFPVNRRALIEQPAGLCGVPLLRRLPKGSSHCLCIICRSGHVLGCEGRQAGASEASQEVQPSFAFAAAVAIYVAPAALRWSGELSRRCPKHNHAAASTDSDIFWRSARSWMRLFAGCEGSVEAVCNDHTGSYLFAHVDSSLARTDVPPSIVWALSWAMRPPHSVMGVPTGVTQRVPNSSVPAYVGGQDKQLFGKARAACASLCLPCRANVRTARQGPLRSTLRLCERAKPHA